MYGGNWKTRGTSFSHPSCLSHAGKRNKSGMEINRRFARYEKCLPCSAPANSTLQHFGVSGVNLYLYWDIVSWGRTAIWQLNIMGNVWMGIVGWMVGDLQIMRFKCSNMNVLLPMAILLMSLLSWVFWFQYPRLLIYLQHRPELGQNLHI